MITEIGSLQSQAASFGWKAGVFHFGKASVPGTDFFNPAIIRKHDGLWLITRRSKWAKDQDFGVNDLMAFKLNEHLHPQFGVPIKCPKHFEGEHFEDPRASVLGGRIFIGCCTFVWSKKRWTGAHQALFEVNDRWESVQRWDLDYGGNGRNTGQNTRHNKNWLWFGTDFPSHMIYWANPHTVIEGQLKEKFTLYHPLEHIAEIVSGLSDAWGYGEIRGGTNPVLVNNEWWTFFHSSTPWTSDKRQYHMGAYAFENKPPFRITKITVYPILSGSKHDRWAQGKPLVVFPCGNIFENGEHLVTYGINDLDCGWVRIPHVYLENIVISLDAEDQETPALPLSELHPVPTSVPV